MNTGVDNTALEAPALFVVMNHALTEEQIKDARHALGIAKIITMPEDLKKIWENIPPDILEIGPLLAPFEKWLETTSRKNDVVLIQGDFGACYLVVSLAFSKGLVPVYATTKREVVETPQADGSVRIERHFRHVMFRKYRE